MWRQSLRYAARGLFFIFRRCGRAPWPANCGAGAEADNRARLLPLASPMAVEPFRQGAGFSSSLVMEIAMKSLRILPLAAGAMLVAATITALAQGNANSGTANPDAAKNQPFMPSGAGLKGPPHQFPAGRRAE